MISRRKLLAASALLAVGAIAIAVVVGPTQHTTPPHVASDISSAVNSQTPHQGPANSGSTALSAGVQMTSDVSPATQQEQTRAQIQITEEILRSRNDNDPRMDSELRDLTPRAREALKARYAQLPREARAERGTLVFLLGRNLRTEGDFAFLKEVLKEPPCQSLADCNRPPENEDPHHEPINRTTLSYPSLAALSLLEKWGEEFGYPAVISQPNWAHAQKVLEAGRASSDPMVARKASDLSARWHLGS